MINDELEFQHLIFNDCSPYIFVESLSDTAVYVQ
jgi:hypothetical protein